MKNIIIAICATFFFVACCDDCSKELDITKRELDKLNTELRVCKEKIDQSNEYDTLSCKGLPFATYSAFYYSNFVYTRKVIIPYKFKDIDGDGIEELLKPESDDWIYLNRIDKGSKIVHLVLEVFKHGLDDRDDLRNEPTKDCQTFYENFGNNIRSQITLNDGKRHEVWIVAIHDEDYPHASTPQVKDSIHKIVRDVIVTKGCDMTATLNNCLKLIQDRIDKIPKVGNFDEEPNTIGGGVIPPKK